MQAQMAHEKITGHSADNTFSITINGNQEVLEVNVSPDIDLNHPEIEKNIKEAFNNAQEKLKARMVEKFQGMV